MAEQTKHSVCFSSFRFLLAARRAAQHRGVSGGTEKRRIGGASATQSSIHPSIHLLGQLTKRLAHTHGHPSISSPSVRPSHHPSTIHPSIPAPPIHIHILIHIHYKTSTCSRWSKRPVTAPLTSGKASCFPVFLPSCCRCSSPKWTGLNAFVRSLFSLTLIEFCEFCFSCLCQFSFYRFLRHLTHWAQGHIDFLVTEYQQEIKTCVSDLDKHLMKTSLNYRLMTRPTSFVEKFNISIAI